MCKIRRCGRDRATDAPSQLRTGDATHNARMSRRPAPWTRIRSGLEQDFIILRVHEDVFVDPRDGSEHARAIIDADDWTNVVALTPDDRIVVPSHPEAKARRIPEEMHRIR